MVAIFGVPANDQHPPFRRISSPHGRRTWGSPHVWSGHIPCCRCDDLRRFLHAYLTFKAVNPLPEGAVYELELPLPILNTILLLVSSATFHRAGQAIRRSDHKSCRRWLLISAGLGFARSQMVEYFTLPFELRQSLCQHILRCHWISWIARRLVP